MYVPYATLLDAARRHFERVAGSPNYTRPARHEALRLARMVGAELAAANRGDPQRVLMMLEPPRYGAGPAWDGEPEPRFYTAL